MCINGRRSLDELLQKAVVAQGVHHTECSRQCELKCIQKSKCPKGILCESEKGTKSNHSNNRQQLYDSFRQTFQSLQCWTVLTLPVNESCQGVLVTHSHIHANNGAGGWCARIAHQRRLPAVPFVKLLLFLELILDGSHLHARQCIKAQSASFSMCLLPSSQ